MADRTTTAAVHAAGGVVWRDRADGAPGEIEISLVHRPRYDDWSLPKGKLDDGEHALQAAVREVAEETGQRAVCGRGLGIQRYDVTGPDGRPQPKVVRYWAMRARGGQFVPSDEVDDLRWVPPGTAYGLLTWPRDGEVVRRLAAAPYRTTTVLLVRHGSAGDRSSWRADDMLRPLDHRGRRQADRIGHVLGPAFAPDRVAAAEPVRCVQTVQALATGLGLDVSAEPAFGDKVYADDPAGARRRLREITADGRTTALCSQGGAIPHLVAALADEAAGARWPAPQVRRSDGSVRSRKGSVWVLSFDPGTKLLVDALYLRDLAPPP